MATALDFYEHALKVFEENDIDEGTVPVGILMQRLPSGKLTASQREMESILADLPSFETKLKTRNAFEDIGAVGMLHLYEKQLSSDPAKRITASHVRSAAKEAAALTTDILATVMEPA